jgi:GntR family transcriptional regulator, rspAB operon transcriptional repressor
VTPSPTLTSRDANSPMAADSSKLTRTLSCDCGIFDEAAGAPHSLIDDREGVACDQEPASVLYHTRTPLALQTRIIAMAERSLRPARRNQVAILRGASTRTHVYNVIRRAIISLELAPGQALSENELATRYAVSRTPVREALIRLADDGLIEVVPQLGTFVSRISVRDVIEVQFIRETLERASLPHAIKLFEAGDERRLRRILSEQEDAEHDGDLQRWFATDEDLHRTLLEIGNHPKIWPIVSSAKAHLDRVRILTLPDPEHLRALRAQHAAIVDSVIAKDRKAADAMLKDHLHLVIDVLEGLERKHPDYFVEDDPA